MDEAAVEFKALMTAYPDLTVTKYKKALVYSPVTLDRMAAHMKTVGLPD
jgi:adenylate cyclase